MANEVKKEPTSEDLMKAIHGVLDEALGEYDALMKNEGIDYAQAIDDKKGAGPMIVGEGTKDGMAKEDPEMKPEDKEEEDKDEDEDEEKLMNTYKSLVAKMEKKGLMAKMDKAKMKKSETAPTEAAPAPKSEPSVEGLRKSVDERFDVLHKAIVGVQEVVKKIAAQPAAPRKGVAGYQPLRKSEGETAPALKKGEVIDKLLELKKSGDARVDSTLINRVETGRLIKSDYERIKGILG